ncbi:MAG TPA: 4'-phosphopantetheinyl transferase superfamily protein [Pyrinomonadaceae bacterium]|jgi:4'-phosphopantetheinyl transferase EntD
MATAPHTKTEATAARFDDCFVGWLDVCELQDREYTSHLSVDERAKYLSLRGERRKSEWLAGRLAAKHLFLNWLEPAREIRSGQWNPGLSRLSGEALAAYSPWMYRKVEVLSDGEKPGLVWCGRKRKESLSISHAGGISCASIALEKPVAIDVETAVDRHGAFYRNTFTEVEKNWVARVGGDDGLSSANWCFTLLWSLKESVLKLGWLDGASIWNLSRIEIDGLPGLNQPGFNRREPFWRSRNLSDAFVVFTARVKEPRRAMRVQVAVTGTRNFVLTVMNPLIGAVN